MVPREYIGKLIEEMPKTELHLHLEGAIPLETLYELILRGGGDPSIQTIEDLEKKLTYTDFAHFIDVWTWMTSFIKEDRNFEEIAYQVLRNLSEQNVKYVEAFYSPGDYWRLGLSVQKITEYMIKGKQRAYNDFGIRSELILDLVRNHGPDVGIQRLEEVTPYLGKGVIGIGLGGSEQKFPADPYAYVYKEAKRRGFRLTAHAGEAVGPNSIWAALKKLRCERIGHGVRAKEDPQLIPFLKECQIPLEICVISNVKTKVCESVESHPIKQYYEDGLMVTVNSDDPTMFNTSITQEYLVIAQKLNFTVNDIKQLTMNGIEASFMSEKEKEAMKAQFAREWHQLIDNDG
ncbi:MAG: adenosine deaminase [Candidatus Heimdallarchaeota archaeon]